MITEGMVFALALLCFWISLHLCIIIIQAAAPQQPTTTTHALDGGRGRRSGGGRKHDMAFTRDFPRYLTRPAW